MLMGARYDAAIHTATDMSLRIGLPTLSGDDDETVGNEAGTMLKLNGEEFPISDLLEGGMAELMGKNFVAEALAEIQKLRDAVDAYISLDGTDDDTGDYDMQIRILWNDRRPGGRQQHLRHDGCTTTRIVPLPGSGGQPEDA